MTVWPLTPEATDTAYHWYLILLMWVGFPFGYNGGPVMCGKERMWKFRRLVLLVLGVVSQQSNIKQSGLCFTSNKIICCLYLGVQNVRSCCNTFLCVYLPSLATNNTKPKVIVPTEQMVVCLVNNLAFLDWMLLQWVIEQSWWTLEHFSLLTEVHKMHKFRQVLFITQPP